MTTLKAISVDAPTSASPRSTSRLTTLRRAFAAELIKLGTVRSTIWLLCLAALSLVGVGVVNAIGVVVRAAHDPTFDRATVDPAGASLSGLGSAWLPIAVLGILAVTGDYSTGMIKTTIAAMPSRSNLVLGKVGALITAVLPVTVASTMITFVTAKLILGSSSIQISIFHPGVLRALVGSALYLAVLSVFAAGLGWLVRSTAGSLVTWLALWIVPTFLLMLLPGKVAAVVQPFLPGEAGTMISETTGVGAAQAWSDFAVFAGYALIISVIAGIVLNRRDA